MTPICSENCNTFDDIGGDPADDNNKLFIRVDEQDPVFPGDVRSRENGDLKYLTNKVIFVSKDGSFRVMDNAMLRLKRLQKRLEKWAEIVRVKAEFLPVRIYQIGLSYKPGNTWREHDISEYLKSLRKYTGSENFVGYSWVAEMQKRMEVHYHLVAITTEACRKIPLPDKKGHWKNGSSSRVEVSSSGVNYLTSDYMKKREQKSNYPKGIRAHATWLNGKYFDEFDFWALRSVSYPVWLVYKINHAGLINPVINGARGGGFMVKVGSEEYFWKNGGGSVLTGQKAIDFLDFEKYKYPVP